ncbi:MAG: LPS export ABC transporter periplasmic protein LptC, partial [Prevotellaceae bacterium]|nr:LPS export ABC transporter periplasmic protein LptC [Prevotellaceae bacterium]
LTRYEVKRTRGYIPMPSAFGNSPAPANTASR